MAEHGRVASVTLMTAGDEVVATAAIAATTLFVGDVADFDEDGGYCLINGVVYEYTAIDDDLSTITLATGLLAAATVDDDGAPRVDVWDMETGSPVVEYIAQVTLDDSHDGDPLDAVIDHSLISMFDASTRGGVGESVLLEFEDEDDVRVTGIIGKAPIVDASFLNPGTIPDPVAIEPPAASPIIRVSGTPTGLVIIAEAIPAADSIEYHISTTDGFTPTAGDPTTLLPVATKATVFVANTAPDGTPLTLGVTYYVRSLAVNAAGVAPAASPQVSGLLDIDGVYEFIAGEIVAGRVAAGRVEVGTGYWSADDGLVLPQPDGSTTRFPVDGINPNTLAGRIISREATFEDKTSLYGATTLFGVGQVASGILPPTTGPTAVKYWPSLLFGSGGSHFPQVSCGLVADGSGNWVTLEYVSGSNAPYIRRHNATTGAYVDAYAITGLAQVEGITKIGSSYYVLGWTGIWGSVKGQHKVYVFNSSFTKTAEFNVGPSTGLNSNATGIACAIGTDGTDVLIAFCTDAGNTYGRNYTTAGVVGTTTLLEAATPAATVWSIGGVAKGSFDLGATRWMIARRSSRTYVESFNTSGVLQTADRWYLADTKEWCFGLYWDGTRFWTMGRSGDVRKYSAGNPTVKTVNAAATWYDGNASGSGTHETSIGVDGPAFAWSARCYAKYDVPLPPDALNVSGTPVDKANQAKLYAGTTTVRKLQATLAIGIREVILETPDTGSANPPGANGFASGTDQPAGRWESAISDGNGPLIKLNGSGAGNRLKSVMLPIEIESETWHNATMTSPYTAGATAPQYRMDAAGNVHIRGIVNRNAATDGNSAFTLPSGYRPSAEQRFIIDVASTTFVGRLIVGTDGTCKFYEKSGAATVYVVSACFSIL